MDNENVKEEGDRTLTRKRRIKEQACSGRSEERKTVKVLVAPWEAEAALYLFRCFQVFQQVGSWRKLVCASGRNSQSKMREAWVPTGGPQVKGGVSGHTDEGKNPEASSVLPLTTSGQVAPGLKNTWD